MMDLISRELIKSLEARTFKGNRIQAHGDIGFIFTERQAEGTSDGIDLGDPIVISLIRVNHIFFDIGIGVILIGAKAMKLTITLIGTEDMVGSVRIERLLTEQATSDREVGLSGHGNTPSMTVEEIADDFPMREFGRGKVGEFPSDDAISLPFSLVLIPDNDDVDVEGGGVDHEDITAEDGIAVAIEESREEGEAVGFDAIIAEENIAVFVLLVMLGDDPFTVGDFDSLEHKIKHDENLLRTNRIERWQASYR